MDSKIEPVKVSQHYLHEFHFGRVGDVFDGWTIVEKFPWVSEGKYDHHTIIIEKNGQHYENLCQRAGSYFSEYEYFFDEECYPVEQVVVTSSQWQRIQEPKVDETIIKPVELREMP